MKLFYFSCALILLPAPMLCASQPTQSPEFLHKSPPLLVSQGGRISPFKLDDSGIPRSITTNSTSIQRSMARRHSIGASLSDGNGINSSPTSHHTASAHPPLVGRARSFSQSSARYGITVIKSPPLAPQGAHPLRPLSYSQPIGTQELAQANKSARISRDVLCGPTFARAEASARRVQEEVGILMQKRELVADLNADDRALLITLSALASQMITCAENFNRDTKKAAEKTQG